MRNLRLEIEYDGTGFYGWQKQPDRRTIQAVLEQGISRILNEEIRIIGASRTDQGVHALAQVANFLTENPMPVEKIRKGVNAVIDDDVYVKTITETAIVFHSRFSALSKKYRYYILTHPSPLRNRYAWAVPYLLDFDKMEKAAVLFCGRHDFRLFSVQENQEKNTICHIKEIYLTMKQSEIIIDLHADRFLRRMVRGLVGFLVDIGRSRYQIEDLRKVLNGQQKEIFFAPAHGLFLVEVIY